MSMTIKLFLYTQNYFVAYTEGPTILQNSCRLHRRTDSSRNLRRLHRRTDNFSKVQDYFTHKIIAPNIIPDNMLTHRHIRI